MSVFRKFAPGAGVGGFQRKSSLPGTKSWVYGQSLLSTGCSDLDNACGTGIPLGSIMMVSEEMGIHQASVLGRLFMAEGIHSKQRVLVVSSKSSEAVSAFLAKLPSIRVAANADNVTVGRSVTNQSSSVHVANQSSSVPATNQSPSMNANSTSPQPTAKPRAWQYGKYLSHTSTLAHSLSHRPNRSHSLLPLLRPQPEREGCGAS